jgi:hypothetical protein
MDPEPRAVHTAQCDEDPTLRMTSGGECMCKFTTVMLSQRLLMVEPSHHCGSDLDQSDHKDEHAGP